MKIKINKKKMSQATILLLLISLVTFSVIHENSKMIEKVYEDEITLAPNSGTKYANVSFQRTGVHISQGWLTAMYLNGTWALCIENSKFTTSGTSYQSNGEISDNLNAKKALAYLMKTNPNVNNYRGLLQFTVAQLVAWGHNSTNDFIDAHIEIYKSYYGGLKAGGTNDSIKNKTISSLSRSEFINWWNDRDQAMASPGEATTLDAYVKSVYSALSKTSPVNALVWKANGKQTLISTSTGGTPKCAVVGNTYYGPNGEKLTGKAEFDKLCDQPNEDTCKPSQSGGDGECTNTEFNDPSWSCIAGNSDYQDLSITNNPYCTIYCRETVNSSFPFETLTFKAGQYLTVGSGIRNVWGPVSFQGTRECRSYYKSGNNWTEGINTNKFVQDYYNAVSNMDNLYNQWQKERARADAANAANAKGKTAPNMCERWDDSFTVASDYYWNGSQRVEYCPDGGTLDKNSHTCKGRTVKDQPGYAGYTYSYWGGTETVGASCEAHSGYDSQYENAYKQANSNRIALENQLRQCENMNTLYTLNPEVTFSYKIGAYNWSGKLKSSYQDSSSATPETGSAQSAHYAGGGSLQSYCSGTSCYLRYYNCSGNHCGTGNVSTVTVNNVNTNSKRTTTSKTATYSLPDNLFKYVDKVQGTVSNSVPSDLRYTKTYIDLGESTIPLDTYVRAGRYTINLSYSKIGNIISNIAHFDKTISDMNSDYKCPIAVKNEITGKECEPDPEGCDPKGLDVIYRTIKLGSASVAFPSIDGDGRRPGDNWYSEDGSLVNNYITNNRGVSGEAVYNLTPLYKITLTPSIIKQIRDYNKKVDYGTYDTLTCSIDESGKATGRNCISSFIHSNVTAGGKSYNFSGYFDSKATCQNITTGSFNSCANK